MELDLPLQNSKRNPLPAFLAKRWPTLLAIFLIILTVITVIFILPRFQKKTPVKPPVSQPVKQTGVPISDQSKKIATFSAEQAIVKVGEETIYKKDLDTELASYPPSIKTEDRTKTLLDKIIYDSIILQGAAADKFIKLDPTVFNSPRKDYAARIKLVQEAQRIILSKEDSISGVVVGIWFFNTKPGKVGYEKGQQIALAKITELHNDVMAGKITIEEAGTVIKNDSSLAQVDAIYKNNAMFKFTITKEQKISFDPEFDKVIRQLKVGEISDVFLLNDQNPQSGKMIPALYTFAQVQKIIQNGSVGTFEDWIANKKKQYEIKYY